MPAWRPAPVIRPIAIGVIRRDDRLLVMAVRDDHDNLKGWRPLGGTIEFGERAADALKREFIEELDQPIQEPVPLTPSRRRSRTRRPITATDSSLTMPA
jgi:ADP-ribose pyrophosphatase YjhB (NUDIX family)